MKIEFNSDSIGLVLEPGDSDELSEIVGLHLPNWLALFAQKNAEYQDGMGTAFVLGPRGQFSDIYRKMMKLKIGLWDGEEEKLTSEGVDEILMDMIGHCFLTLAMRQRAKQEAAIAAAHAEAPWTGEPNDPASLRHGVSAEEASEAFNKAAQAGLFSGRPVKDNPQA